MEISKQHTLPNLPADVWQKIAEYLPITDLYRLSGLKKRWLLTFSKRVCYVQEFVTFVLSTPKRTFVMIKYLAKNFLNIRVGQKTWNTKGYVKSFHQTLAYCKLRVVNNFDPHIQKTIYTFINNSPLELPKILPDAQTIELIKFASKVDLRKVLNLLPCWMQIFGFPGGVVNDCYTLMVVLIINHLGIHAEDYSSCTSELGTKFIKEARINNTVVWKNGQYC